jgi:hypothetical protein
MSVACISCRGQFDYLLSPDLNTSSFLCAVCRAFRNLRSLVYESGLPVSLQADIAAHLRRSSSELQDLVERSGLVCRITPAIWVRGPVVVGVPTPVSSGDQGGVVPPQAPAPAASGAALLVAKALPVKVEEIPSPATSSKASGVPPVPLVSSDSVGSGQVAGGTEVKSEAVVESGATAAPAAEVETPRTDSAGSVPSVPDTEYTYRASSYYRSVPARQLPATPKPASPGLPVAPPTPPPPPVSREDREARVDWGRRREATPSEDSHDDRPHDIKKRKKNKGIKKRERGRNWFNPSQPRGDRGGGHPPGGSSSALSSR